MAVQALVITSQVRQFMQWTQAGERTAIACLGTHNWSVEVACDAFFTHPARFAVMEEEKSRLVDDRKLEHFFLKYAIGSLSTIRTYP